ncbi:MAG: hypothetical protein F6K23_31205 [Okeania sp. SIO2C9]|uniref:choice-of-anchor W domain-containing protein n=1 Tax=Okeania sp. SIO2C9 TaxID=2607791 RepID=UPI0013C23E20|nr:choice-of-anchor W domain-containing protein [Okeania sp. SIO2C9]NEQ77088.1 hypothetical protein [Okeania sp. SIO2C9]
MKIFLYYPLKRGDFKPQFFGKQGNSVVVDNLILNSQAIAENSSFVCSEEGCGYWNSSQYLWLTDLEESFTLTGTTTMIWTGDAKDLKDKTAPHRSQLAFQVKLGDVIMGEVLAKDIFKSALFCTIESKILRV